MVFIRARESKVRQTLHEYLADAHAQGKKKSDFALVAMRPTRRVEVRSGT